MLHLKGSPYTHFRGNRQSSRHLVLKMQKSCFPFCHLGGGEKKHEGAGGRKRREQKTRKASVNFWSSLLTAGKLTVHGHNENITNVGISPVCFVPTLWNYIWSCSRGSRQPVHGKRKRWWILLGSVPCSEQILSGVDSILNGGLTWIYPTVTF